MADVWIELTVVEWKLKQNAKGELASINAISNTKKFAGTDGQVFNNKLFLYLILFL